MTWPWALAWGHFFWQYAHIYVYCSMRETKPNPSQVTQDLTFSLPLHGDSQSDNHTKARSLFVHIESETPNIAEAIVSDSTYLNDAAFSCVIAPYGCDPSDKGLRFFLANPDEGFDFAQVFAGPYCDETIDIYGDHDGKFTDVADFTDWLFKVMQPKHPMFKDFGITPLFLMDRQKINVYLTLLHRHGLGYHMDDCPWDCLRDADLTIWERVLIHYYHDQCINWCKENDACVHGICLEVMANALES